MKKIVGIIIALILMAALAIVAIHVAGKKNTTTPAQAEQTIETTPAPTAQPDSRVDELMASVSELTGKVDDLLANETAVEEAAVEPAVEETPVENDEPATRQVNGRTEFYLGMDNNMLSWTIKNGPAEAVNRSVNQADAVEPGKGRLVAVLMDVFTGDMGWYPLPHVGDRVTVATTAEAVQADANTYRFDEERCEIVVDDFVRGPAQCPKGHWLPQARTNIVAAKAVNFFESRPANQILNALGIYTEEDGWYYIAAIPCDDNTVVDVHRHDEHNDDHGDDPVTPPDEEQKPQEDKPAEEQKPQENKPAEEQKPQENKPAEEQKPQDDKPSPDYEQVPPQGEVYNPEYEAVPPAEEVKDGDKKSSEDQGTILGEQEPAEGQVDQDPVSPEDPKPILGEQEPAEGQKPAEGTPDYSGIPDLSNQEGTPDYSEVDITVDQQPVAKPAMEDAASILGIQEAATNEYVSETCYAVEAVAVEETVAVVAEPVAEPVAQPVAVPSADYSALDGVDVYN